MSPHHVHCFPLGHLSADAISGRLVIRDLLVIRHPDTAADLRFCARSGLALLRRIAD